MKQWIHKIYVGYFCLKKGILVLNTVFVFRKAVYFKTLCYSRLWLRNYKINNGGLVQILFCELWQFLKSVSFFLLYSYIWTLRTNIFLLFIHSESMLAILCFIQAVIYKLSICVCQYKYAYSNLNQGFYFVQMFML